MELSRGDGDGLNLIVETVDTSGAPDSDGTVRRYSK